MVKQKKTKEELITPVKCSDQKPKPTPEQMRIAQILEKRVVDSSIKMKLKQIMDATQRTADEVYVALHDSDFDVNQAVDLLIDGDSMADWCTNDKKKKKIQELKDKKTEENSAIPDTNVEVPKVSRNPSFKGRGDDRQRPSRGRGSNLTERRQRNNVDDSTTYRGRGPQGRGRKNPRPSTGGTMVFERSRVEEINDTTVQPVMEVRNRWERPLFHSPEEDWDTEEFTGSLSKTQIFTSSVKPEVPKVNNLIPEELNKIPISDELSGDTLPLPSSSPLTSASTPQSYVPHDMNAGGIGSTSSPLTKGEAPQKEARSSIVSHSNSPESPPDYMFRLSNYSAKPVNPVQTIEERKHAPSKIPTSAVEMPPEMNPSLSFLDIQFGAIDLGPSACEVSSSESHSISSSQNTSSTTLMPLSSVPSSGSITSSGNFTSNCNIAGGTSVINSSTATPPSVTRANHPMAPNSIPSGANINHGMSQISIPASGNVSHMTPNSINLGSAQLLGPSALTSSFSGNQAQGRFATSQSFNSTHIPYSYIQPSTGGSTHQYNSRTHETNTSMPPPHLAQPSHLPSFKQAPPGVPKGAIMTNIPAGQLVGNQYLVGQGPYYSPHTMYYYEEMPSVINNQQRMTHISGYDVTYQPNRDGVHYT